MCSIDTDSVQEMVPVLREVIIGPDVECRKCGVASVEVILRKTDPYCRTCYLQYASHKFRSCLGKHKQVPARGQVCVGTSGGLASTALLHLLHDGLQLNTVKKLHLHPSFLHVDVSCASEFLCPSNTKISSVSIAESACQAVVNCNYPVYYTTLEAVLADRPVTPVPYLQGRTLAELRHDTSSPALQSRLHDLLAACGSPSAMESTCRSLLSRCLILSSRELHKPQLLVGDSASRLAEEILSSMAEGRGAHVARQVSFQHVDADTGVQVLRPLRELLREELVHYLALSGVTVQEDLTVSNTIRCCTFNFLAQLQENFPNTISTVFKTGDKLVFRGSGDSSSASFNSSQSCSTDTLASFADDTSPTVTTGRCGLCHAAIDTCRPPASALQATEVSQRISAAAHHKTGYNRSINFNGDVNKLCFSNDDFTDVHIDETIADVAVLNTGPLEDVQSVYRDSSSNASKGAEDAVDPATNNSLDDALLDKYEPLLTRMDLNAVLCYGCRITLQKMDQFSLLPRDLRVQACRAVEARLVNAGINKFHL